MKAIFFDTVGIPVDAPDFYQQAYSLVEKSAFSSKSKNSLETICNEDYDFLSQKLDAIPIQESCSVRNVLRCRALGIVLIDDKGEFNIPIAEKVISLLQKDLYSLGPGREFDAARQEHIIKIVSLLKDRQELRQLLKQIAKPYRDIQAEQIIRETLGLQANYVVSDADARRAALSALMTTLRQNVGSCFATAPCIIIHKEQPHLFLKDISELFSSGRLKKTFSGIEYTVPLSPSWGAGDLRKPFLFRGVQTQEEVGVAPGIIHGLVAAGLIDQTLPFKSQISEGQKLAFAWFQNLQEHSFQLVISAEELLKEIILKSFNLTNQDLQEYNSRSKYLPMARDFSPTLQGGKGGNFTGFYDKFNAAMAAFKALADNALLKSWEFTLASFSEVKSQFSTWNLYSSLGFEPQEPFGIGEIIYKILKDKIEVAKGILGELQISYEQSHSHILYLQTRLRTSRDEQDAEYVKRELRLRSAEFDSLDEQRKDWHYKAQRYSSLLNYLIDIYSSLFPQYFQEVYDADMHEVSQGPYDDSPAGFRLIYKHGRSSTTQWMRIKSPEEFIESLASFFNAVEPAVIDNPDLQGLETDIRDLTSSIIAQIRTQEFLETSFHRMARAHHTAPIKDPLKNLDKIAIKPWAYTSGGIIDTFVCSYWKRDEKPTERGRWVESPTELMVFLADIMKELPPQTADAFIQNPDKSMLIHSPTHAFLFKPGLLPFKKGWQNSEFTYTFVRDQFIAPHERFYDLITLDQQSAYFLKDKLLKKIPDDYRHYLGQALSYFPGGMTPKEFRDYILNILEKEVTKSTILQAETIDSMLYSQLPLSSGSSLSEKIREILETLPGIDKGMLEKFDTLWFNMPISLRPDPIVTAETLLNVTKAVVCMLLEKTTFSYDYHRLIIEAAQQLGYASPKPILFADTNWVRDLFGFTVNPGTLQCELWRFSPNGEKGAPMNAWKHWLDGSNTTKTWGIYVRPHEYTL